MAVFSRLVGVSMTRAGRGCLAALLAVACHEAGSEECGALAVDPRTSEACIASQPSEVGRIANAALIESSGLIASRTQPGVLYTHNDSGDAARFFAIDVSGQTLAEFDLSAATALDWEDVAIGPSQSGGDLLYFGDIGDNSLTDASVAPRDQIQIVRVREPFVSPGQLQGVQTLASWETISLTYPDGHHDAEALLADPSGAELWIVTKSSDGRAGIYSVPASVPANSLSTLSKRGELSLGSCSGAQITAGDISKDGRSILLRTYRALLLWERTGSESVADTLRRAPRSLPAPAEAQGEAIAFSADGQAWFSTGEGAGAAIFSGRLDCR